MSDGDQELLLRIWWRKTALEGSLQDIIDAEFSNRDGTPDLSPSLYAISAAELVQVVTEHYAGNGADTVKNESGGHLDVSSIITGLVQSTPGNEWFSRANQAHRELSLADISALKMLVSKLSACARHPFSRNDAKAYIRQRVENDDAEWSDFLEWHPNGDRYRKWIR